MDQTDAYHRILGHVVDTEMRSDEKPALTLEAMARLARQIAIKQV